MILNHFPLPETPLRLLDTLADAPQDAFAFLDGFFAARESLALEGRGGGGGMIGEEEEEGEAGVSSAVELPSEIFERYLELLCDAETAAFSSKNNHNSSNNNSLSSGSHHGGKVVDFLKNTSERFDEKVALNICKSRENWEAAALLLERCGKILDAFELHRRRVETAWAALVGARNDEDDADEDAEAADEPFQRRLRWTMEAATGVCEFAQRHSPTMNEDQREKLWFSLLEVVLKTRAAHRKPTMTTALPPTSSLTPPASPSVSPSNAERLPASPSFLPAAARDQQPPTRSGLIDDALKSLTCHTLNAMMTYVSPPAILTKIINDNAVLSGGKDAGGGSSGVQSFVDMKQLLLSMLETFSYETVLLTKTKSVLIHDLNDRLGQLAACASRASPFAAREK